MNFVMSSDGGFIEVQGTGEERPLSRKELDEMLRLAEQGCNTLSKPSAPRSPKYAVAGLAGRTWPAAGSWQCVRPVP